MARHEIITKKTDMKIYFSIPSSSWEREQTKTQMESLEDICKKE